MFKLLPCLAFALALTALAPAVQANEPGMPRSERLFGRLDTNSDGRLGIEEMRPQAERRFMHLDTDGDGKVTTAEIDAWLAPYRQLWSVHLDALERHLDTMPDTRTDHTV